jgi:hypothetical protein
MSHYRPLTFLVFPALIVSLAFSTACQTYHTGMSDAEITTRVQNRFWAGMSTDRVRSKIRTMRFTDILDESKDDPDHGIHAGDLGLIVWPKRFIVNGILSYYGRDIMLFRFGGDNALDDVVWRPFGWRKNAGDPLVIELPESEVTP